MKDLQPHFFKLLVSVVFHNNPECFSKTSKKETLFHYMVLKTWFWAIFRAKNETNRICWSQTKKTRQKFEGLWPSKCWLSSPSKLMGLFFSNFQNQPIFDLTSSQNKENPHFRYIKTLKFYKLLGSNVRLEVHSHKKLELIKNFHFLPYQKWKIARKNFKMGTICSETQT